MTYTEDTDFEALAHALIGCTLPKTDWTHEAHFAAALWFIRHPERDAEREMPSTILAYNEATGVPNTDREGYHETITLASLRMAERHLRTHCEAARLGHVLSTLMDGPLGHSGWLLTYWSRPVLFSVAARRRWVGPDLQKLPV
ncbi:MAG: hypothetical protein AAF768_00335 [Pseudomonadota bacterium]